MGTQVSSKAITFASMLSENILNMCSLLTGLPAWSVYVLIASRLLSGPIH